jgi:GTP-binding protein
VRRRRRVEAGVEKFSIVKTLQAVADSNVSILLIDAHEGLVEQDLHLLGHVIEAGRAVVVAVNKWDGLSDDERQFIRDTLERRLRFVDFADIHFISALHGSGVGHLYESVHVAYAAATGKIQTNKLTQILEKAVAQHAPPLIGGRRIKMRYAHAGGMNPPIIVIHGNQVDKVPDSYSRYLEKFFREELELTGTPLKMEYRNSDNPYEGKKNKLTGRQIERKKRLIKHIKKSEHSRKKKR